MKIGHYKSKCKSIRTIQLFISALFCKKIKFQTQNAQKHIFQIYYELLNVRAEVKHYVMMLDNYGLDFDYPHVCRIINLLSGTGSGCVAITLPLLLYYLFP